MTRHDPSEAAVRAGFKEERERVPDEPAPAPGPAEGEDGSTDEGAGDQPAPEASGAGVAEEQPAEPQQAEDEDELTAARRERDQYLDLAKRTQADFENYRKRASKDVAASGARARAGLIRELLPVVDNLERALASAPADDPMAEGVKLVLMDLQGVLGRAGVETIEPKGETFDPNVHEALTTRQEEGVEAGVVLDVVEKGYRGADHVIRPARVIVAA